MPDVIERLRGAVADRYDMERRVGSGGMAEIYLAEDLKHHRKVAVKVLRPDLSFTLGAERFLREIAIAANLTHPHILPLHDSGMADGLFYYVMPYFEGESLAGRMKREPVVPLPDAMQITWEVAAALDFAHRRDIVHRDIKPGNILLADGHAVVADFGIARAISAAGGNSLTQTGLPIGTPRYWSPEQASGGEVIDGRSDIHSLGRVLYQMLVGQLPLRACDKRSVRRGQFVDLPAEHQARVDMLPSRVVRAMVKALAEAPTDRFATAREFADALVPRKARSSTSAPRVDASPRPGVIAVGVTIVLAVLVGVVMTSSGASWLATTGAVAVTIGAGLAVAVRRFRTSLGTATESALRALSTSGEKLMRSSGESESVRSIAVLPFADMSPQGDHEYLSDGIAEELLNALAKIDGLRVAARTSSFHFKGKHLNVRRIGKELGVETILEGSVRKSDSRIRITAQLVSAKDGFHLWTETYDRALEDVFLVQQEIAAEIVEALRLRLAPTGSQPAATLRMPDPEAHNLYLKGRFLWNKRTEAGLEQAVEFFRQAIEIDASYALAYAGLADAYLLLGSYGHMPGVEALRLTKEAAQRALALDETLAEAHATMGQVLRSELDWAGEEREYKRAIQLNPNYATAHQWYATHLMALGRKDEALREIRRAEALDPLSSAIGVTVGIILVLSDEIDEALAHLDKTRAMAPDFFAPYAWISLAYMEKGMEKEALEASERVLELNEIPGLVNVAQTHARAGRREEALRYLDRFKNRGGQLVPAGIIHAYLGEIDMAFECLERALDEEGWSFFTLHRTFLFYIRVGPWFDPLRSDPRFGNLLRRMKFPD